MDSTDLVLQLEDGRQLGYAEYGKPDGRPIFYFHGLPGSRYECGLFHPAAKALGVRIISLDRPGYGLSTAQPGRTLKAWPQDVKALADALELQHFSVIGVSGGGPCALACARALPERIEATSIACGLGPVSHKPLMQDMNGVARLAFYLGERNPALLLKLYGLPLEKLSTSHPDALIRMMGAIMTRPDRQALLHPESRQALSASLREAFGQGLQGALDDVQIYARDWSFDLHDINGRIRLWHGDSDRVVPLSHSEYLDSQLPDSELEVIPGEGHFSLPINLAHRIVERM